MPRRDGTGPMGCGPLSGRAAGYCGGNGTPGAMSPGFGSWGRCGIHRMFRATGAPGWTRFADFTAVEPVLETRRLENQISWMEQSLKNAKDRLNQLKQHEE